MLNTGVMTNFFGSFFGGAICVDMGAGDDTVTIGRPFDPTDFVAVYFTATLRGGIGTDAIHYQDADNEILWDRFIQQFEVED